MWLFLVGVSRVLVWMGALDAGLEVGEEGFAREAYYESCGF